MHDMEKFVNYLKTHGFVFQGSEIYGGLANSWDYGHLGVELKNNLKKIWWQKFVSELENNIGIDSSILMNSKVWESSGHIGGFSDPLIDCKKCKTRFRADHLIENATDLSADGKTNDELVAIINENKIICPNCKGFDYTNIRQFNLMFKTNMGVLEDESSVAYLRPETAQGIFINFKNVQRTSRKKVPFGIGQIGKSFRNEISPGNFIFRTREFEQMELEFFTHPDEADQWFDFYVSYCYDFLTTLGLKKEHIHKLEIDDESRAHYSARTIDIEFDFYFGRGELWGIANRTDYDLKQHQNHSKQSMEYLDPQTNQKYIPYVIEPSVGVDRLMLAILMDSYEIEKLEDEDREVLKLHPILAPYKVAVLPLVNKLKDEALEVFKEISLIFNADFDTAGTIGKRYRRQDAYGTPICITYDYASKDDNQVTVRDRDTMLQERVNISDLVEYISKKIKY